MKIGERIKKFRIERGLSVAFLANELGVARSTIYRYEENFISKLPKDVFDRLCEVFDVSPAVMMGELSEKEESDTGTLPEHFDDVQEAMKWIIKIPSLAAYGEYDPDSMSEETIVDFANEILQQLKLVSYKYKK